MAAMGFNGRLSAIKRSRTGFVLLWLAVALTFFLIKPIIFVGGGSDDQRYLDAARAWIAHGPVVGTVHWDLRHPLVLPIAAATRLFGERAFGLLVVPIGYALALMAVSLMFLRERFGIRVASIWALFFATNPLIHELATRLYPDLAEAFFVIGSLVACADASRRRGTPRIMGLALAGVLASLAMLTRETSYVLPLAYAAAFVIGRPFARRDWLIVAAGAIPLLAFETIWLWQATGDPLYRVHIALRHVDVPSNHMAGKVFGNERVLFNPDLASRWIVDGPIDVHWTINPLIYFFLAPFYGGAFILFALMIGIDRITSQARTVARPGLLIGIGCYAAASYAFVTYALMVSQRPRYYVVPLLVIMLANALLATRLWSARRGWVCALIALHVIASIVIFSVRHASDQGLPISRPITRDQ